MSKKKELSPELKAECDAAKRLFTSRKNALGLTQAKLAAAADISPAAVAMYLNGINPLNAKFASVLANMLGEPVEQFSPRLAAELADMTKAARQGKASSGEGAAPATAQQNDTAKRIALGKSLFDKATPRSQALLNQIATLDAQGKLTSEDLQLLEQIIRRFSTSK